MFDKNYLGHDLYFTDYSKYCCCKCKIVVWVFEKDSKHYTQIVGDIKTLKLTCEEYIIKGIIE